MPAIVAITAVFALAAAVAAAFAGPASAATPVGVYSGSETATGSTDAASVELGTRFQVGSAGTITAIRFYKNAKNTGTHTATLWSSSGAKLASATFTGETSSGWQTAALSTPVAVSPGRTYVASYFTKAGYYGYKTGVFSSGKTLGNSSIWATAGVYRYGSASGFPTSTWSGASYYVDALFLAGGTAPTSPTTSATPTPTPTKTTATPTPTKTTATPTPTPTPTKTTATPTPTPTPTPTKTTASPTPTPTPTSTGAPAQCQRDGSYVWSNLENCNWPGPGNTGPVAAQCPSGLTANSGSTTRMISITAAGTVISCQRITGCLSVQAQNVTIRNVEIACSSGKTGEAANGTSVIAVNEGASATIDHVRIDGMDGVHACIWHQGTAMTATAVDCSGANDGIFSWAYTGYSQTTGDNFTIRDSYFHDFTSKTANGHIDGYQTEGAGNGLIEHNTYLMTSDDGNSTDSAIAIWNGIRSSHDITVRGNLIAGGGFAVYAEDYNPSEASPAGGASVTNIQFADNVFSTRLYGCVGNWGVWYTRGAPTDGWKRSGNTVLETGQNLDAGNPTSGGRVCS